MIVVYTSPGCAGCRKLKQWLKDRNIEYKEKNIFKVLLSPAEIKYLLMRSENGAEDIISKRSKVILENNINIEDMTVEELIRFVQQNPSVLKDLSFLMKKIFRLDMTQKRLQLFLEITHKNFLHLFAVVHAQIGMFVAK